MGKNKPRHDSNKWQNKLGDKCCYYEGYNEHFGANMDTISLNAVAILIIVVRLNIKF